MNIAWFLGSAIKEKHKSLPVKQVYLWFITADNMIAIVGINNKYQFPGGTPDQDESPLEALTREVYEEAGIILADYSKVPTFFGYYVVSKGDGSKFTQLRYILTANKSSKEISLSNNEKEDDHDQLEDVKFVPIKELPKHIPWTKGLEEYSKALGEINT